MEREKFLRVLTADHQEALLACREIRESALRIRGDGAMGAWEALSEGVRGYIEKILLPHFRAEEDLVEAFSYLIGRAHPDLERMREDHQRLRRLLRNGSLDSLLLFADGLEGHIWFEEKRLFPLLQEVLSDEEKRKASRLLEQGLSRDRGGATDHREESKSGRIA